ncbi:MAG: glutaminyl-peptide cyclotransferase [Chloroflexi bacterium]|nr:glutaminyl-peptide cyclotransferase [Chloroflexota bacterium]
MFYYNSRMISSRMAYYFFTFIIFLVLTACSAHKAAISSPTITPSPVPEFNDTVIPDTISPVIKLESRPFSTGIAKNMAYQVTNQFPHDSGAFTEGLAIHNNVLYEATGIYGRSSIRKIDLESGRIEKIRYLSDEYFGEGLAIIDEKIIWITWQSNTGFVLDLDSFEVIDSFSYDHEGWGLAYDGSKLFMSDGSDIIHILEPDNFTETGTIHISDNGAPVEMINELEFIEGDLYANIWQTTFIAKIDPVSGNVTGWLDLNALLEQFETIRHPVDVLNGIAYNNESKQIFITGKYWPKVFEIEILTPD